MVKLSDFRGQPVIVYFYPKAEPQAVPSRPAACATIRPTTRRSGATVLGISPDPVAKVKKFHDK